MGRLTVIAVASSILGLLTAGCGSSESAAPTTPTPTPTTTTTTAAASCPATWKPGWQKLADEIDTPVYCPTWMPDPLDGRMGGPWFNGRFVNAKQEYLVSFAWLEAGVGETFEVHVNFRGYPGSVKVPVCEDTVTVNGKTVHPKLPCFSDARGTRRVGGRTVTVYTANQGADLWHVLYAWRDRGTLYTLSEHVAPPYTYAQVIRNLDRMMRGLDRLPPTG